MARGMIVTCCPRAHHCGGAAHPHFPFSSSSFHRIAMQSRFAIIMIVIALVSCAAAVAAPPARPQNGRQQMSLEGAVQHVQKQTDGRILAADSIPNGRNKLYRIKVLTPDGHVRVMQLHSNDTPSSRKSSRDRKSDGSGGH
jgi:hypothetical protein